ncbi:MAG TPA: type II toxin-antitoxin system PemK/MazF family toxin [Candidatus Atribacteria bacterium]|nr:type II toxin-antitoxin system PemK/MazF family toxin [Candidatus Atribacteria bacterium]
MDISRGDIIYVDLEPRIGSETGKRRPCLVIQNNVINKHAPTTVIVVITSKRRLEHKKKYPTHVWIDKGVGNLKTDSIIQCEQIRTIDKRRIKSKISHLDDDFMQKVEEAVKIVLSIGKYKF